MAILLAILVLLAVLLSLPLELQFDAKWPETQYNRADLRWAFGLVSVDLPRAEFDSAQAGSDEAGPEPIAERGHRQRRSRTPSLRAMLADSLLRQRLYRFLRDCWRAVRKDDVRVECRIGLAEPADTGMLWGVLGPISGGLQTIRDCEILLAPEFSGETFECAAEGKLTVYPIQLSGLFAGLLASPRVWRAFFAADRKS